MINLIDNCYINYQKSFIFLLLFGIKDKANDLWQKIISINIIQLFVVSGLHINIFLNIINKILKNKKIIFVISIIVVFFIGYMVKFSLSTFRIFTYVILMQFK